MSSLLVIAALCLLRLSIAHTWVEQLTNVASNGTFVAGLGFIRNFRERGYGEADNEWLIPRHAIFVNADDLLCHPAQRTAVQTPGYPRLQVLPNSTIAMRYLENGHVTLPERGRPKNGGTVFVFGTQDPREDDTLVNVLTWTRDGSGGDKRGVLLTAQDFDDGRCYQLGQGSVLANERAAQVLNGGVKQTADLACETDVRLPNDMTVGEPFTLYWVWQWPLNDPGAHDQYYTSCVDLDVVTSISSERAEHAASLKDPTSAAVENFLSRGALTQDPLALYSTPPFKLPQKTSAVSSI